MSSSSAYHPGPVEPTPQQRLLLMDDVQWESFIERCARQLEKEGQYAQVLKLGGANDKGEIYAGTRYIHLLRILGTYTKLSITAALSPRAKS